MQETFQPYRSRKIRFFILFLVSMVVFGNQYAFNNPQALEKYMEEDLNIGETQFQLLYTIFAFPNIFATFFLGFLIDFLGVRIGLIALSAGVAVFQLSIAIGGYSYSYTTILIGRMLFGLASESLITAQACMVSFWFKGK
jgi:MFS family permease